MKLLNNIFVRSGLVFLLFFVLFLSVHLLKNGFVSGDDPYYHAKHAALMVQSGNLTLVEPWLEFHFFNYAPTDPWWGFHLGLALFIYCFGLVAGTKIFASFLAALIFLVFYFVLGKLEIKYALFWTLLLFSSSSVFGFRLFLERPHLLSMIVFPLAIYFLINHKNVSLFVLSVLYALSYHLSPLIILLVGVYLLVDAYYKKQISLRPLIASAGGILTGIMLHPHSLNYLYVIYIHLGEVLFLRLAGVDLNIGGELQLLGFFDFIKYNFLTVIFSILFTAMFLAFKKQSKNIILSDFLFLYSSLWLMVALLVPRAVEYWLPAAILFAAVVFNDFLATAEYGKIKKFLLEKTQIKIIGFFAAGAFMVIIFNSLFNIFMPIYQDKTGAIGANYLEANNWLMAHTVKDSVVFYDNWGMWPMMFFYNDYNHYIVGMDPTLLYEYDIKTYWLWHNLSAYGIVCDQSSPCLNSSPAEQIKAVPLTIKNVFRAKYVVAANNPPGNLVKTLNSLRGRAKLVYKNVDLLIYEIL